jgi:uncharacterized protein involved in outer membrane biogenesis
MMPQEIPNPRRPSRGLRVALWLAIVLAVLIVLLLALLSITNWNAFRPTVNRLLSARLHRRVSVDGALTAHLLSWHPGVMVDDLNISNPDWAPGNVVEIDHLAIVLSLRDLLRGHLALDSLLVNNPAIALLSDAQGRNNFDFSAPGTGADNGRPPQLPVVRRFSLNGGRLTVHNAPHKLDFDGQVEANEDAHSPRFVVHGKGTLNGDGFELAFDGDPLSDASFDKPYGFKGDITAGKTHAAAQGSFTRPFDFADIAAHLEVSGENLAHLYNLTGLALPFTPAYKAQGDITTLGHQISVAKLVGAVGKSDIRGDLAIDLAGPRPDLVAHLQSDSLDLADLSPAFGKGVSKDSDGRAQDSVAPGNLPADKLLPTYRFEFDRLRTLDATMTLHASSVQAEKLNIKALDIALKLEDGVLEFTPVTLTLPLGKLTANAHIDARQPLAVTTLDLRVTDVELEQFKSAKSTDAPLKGTLQGRLKITGSGNSVHDLAVNATGNLAAVIPGGEIRKSLAELTGIDLARGLGLILTGNESRTELRCGFAAFGIEHSNATVQQLVLDTEPVLIKGSGKVDLDTEQLDLELAGSPKKIRIGRLRAPVTLGGPLRDPKVGVQIRGTLKQLGVAGAVGALLTPVGAALAFIDPGLAKDANCEALIAKGEDQAK